MNVNTNSTPSVAAPLTDSTVNPLSRRNFLRWSGGCSGLSSTAMLSQLLNLQLSGSAIAAGTGPSDYKALVCIFLLGGNDSHNMLAPYSGQEYDDYVRARGGLHRDVRAGVALDKEARGEKGPELLPIDIGGGRQLGVHHAMPHLRDLYNGGKAAIVANVGSLVEPTTRANYKTVTKPRGLFSHNDLQSHWQTAVPQSRQETTGWLGRMADLMTAESNKNPAIGMNISLDGLNLMQTGRGLVPYVINHSGSKPVRGLGYSSRGNDIYTEVTKKLYPSAVDSELSSMHSSLLERSLAKSWRSSIDAVNEYNRVVPNGTMTKFPSNPLARDLAAVARTIRARTKLGHGRQTFFVGVGGWDHHSDMIDGHDAKLADLSRAIKAFHDETIAMGIEDAVTTFTASDFGRTLSTNGNGTDHAWAGNHFVIGGSVKGGKVYGEYPQSLAPGNPQDLGRGRLIPTTSVDEYSAELASWFGVAASDLPDVLPNLRNFWTPGGSTGPLGFMG